MQLGNYKRRFRFEGVDYLVEIPISIKGMSLIAKADGAEIARDAIVFEIDGTRNLRADATLPDGRVMEIEAGYYNVWSTAIAVRVNGVLVHESHPGKTIAWPKALAVHPGDPADRDARAAQAREQSARFKRNLPSLLTDISLGVVFFLVGREFGIVTAALVGAISGVVLWVLQRITKIDFLGGLAVFGIAVSIISAIYAVLLNDPWLVQMRTTIFGVAIAGLFLSDAVFFKGKLLGARVERYFPAGAAPWRIAAGIGVLGLVMSTANYVVAATFSEEIWLFYTSFLDTPLAMLMGVAVVVFAMSGRKARGVEP